MNLLQAADIAVTLDERKILDGVDLQLRRGECVGLIGPNGAGKTTLLRVLARLQKPENGSVTLDAVNIAALPAANFARRVAYLEQGAPAHWPLRVDTVVALGRLPHLSWWQRPEAADQAAIERALQLAEVDYLRERIVTTLSGGERLRVMLARVFAAEPELILADEPVAALDPYHQLHVMELLREHARRGGAVIAVLHDLNLAARFCDRLLLLAGGRMICAGNARTVLDAAHLREVYGVEARVLEAGGEYAVVPWRRAR
ncbi:MAG: ABC transporter ATP-binding protein [Spongiibacteraceae bacterium]